MSIAGVTSSPPTPCCANCGVLLVGLYCHGCGQSAEDFERSLGSLLGETVESLFHADGRLLHTLPPLVFRPASLTREYLAGRRTSQTPPLRLFLVVILLFFIAGDLREIVQPAGEWFRKDSPTESVPTLTPGDTQASRAFTAWLNPRMRSAVTHQHEFGVAVAGWLHRIAIIFLPISTLLLGVLFISRPRTFLYDHAIFSMHSLSFMALLFTAVTLLGLVGPLRGFAVALVLLAPTHLFFHMRGVYGSSSLGTLARMALMLVFSVLAMVLLLVGVVGLELNGMAP